MGSRPEISDTHENAAQLIPWLINGTLSAAEAASVRAHLSACPTCRADFAAEQRLHDAVRADGPLVFPGELSFQKLLARIEADDFAAAEAPSVPTETAFAAVESAVESAVEGAAEGAAEAPPFQVEAPHASNQTASKRRSAHRELRHSRAAVRWLAAAAVVEAVGLGLGAWAWQTHSVAGASAYLSTAAASRSEAAPYRTLTTPTPSYSAGPRVRVVFRARLSLGQLQNILEGIGAHIVDGPTEAHVYTLGFAESVASVQALDERIAALRADPNVLFAEPAEVRPP